MLVGLCVLSIPTIRHRFYNFFYRMHIPLYIAYLGTMFWHSGNQRDSWAYLWATLALSLFSMFVRLFGKWQTFHIHRDWLSGFPATLQRLPNGDEEGGLVRVSVRVPAELTWKAGSHAFLRMPHLSAFQNHPFTITNMPGHTSKEPGTHEAVFLVRAQAGLTHALLASTSANSSTSSISKEEAVDHSTAVATATIHLDGPYGGIVEDVPALYESLVFVAGGSGIAACLPHMLAAARRIHAGNSTVSVIRLVWMVRRLEHVAWVADELATVADLVSVEALQVDIYVTSGSGIGDSASSNGSEVGGSSEISEDKSKKPVGHQGLLVLRDFPRSVTPGRPVLTDVLPPMLTPRRIFVFGMYSSNHSQFVSI
jgi:predicted ferric reductase